MLAVSDDGGQTFDLHWAPAGWVFSAGEADEQVILVGGRACDARSGGWPAAGAGHSRGSS
jgi:hypothetical protein